MTWIEWVVFGVAAVWGGCLTLALPVFLIVDTRNNWSHGNRGMFGYVHTLARVPLLALIAPVYLVTLAGQAFGYWRD
jgi:hypothetical protein